MKKRFSAVAVAILALASASLASWDYFPPKDAYEGEGRAGIYLDFPYEYATIFSMSLGTRYSIIDGLEVSILAPIPLTYSNAGDSRENYAGLSHPIVGVRYWVNENIGSFLDFTLPVDTREYYVATARLAFGPQFSAELIDALLFGSQLGLVIPFENEYYYRPGMDLTIGVELDYDMDIVIPFVGFDIAFGLTNAQRDGKDIEDSARPTGMELTCGIKANFGDVFSAAVFYSLCFGERYIPEGSDQGPPMTWGSHLSFHF